MRADVKLGVVISVVVVFVAGGYYLYRDRQETAVPMKDGLLSSAEPTQRAKAPSSASPISGSKRPAATGAQRSAKRNTQRPSQPNVGQRLPKPPQRGAQSERVAGETDLGRRIQTRPAAVGPTPATPIPAEGAGARGMAARRTQPDTGAKDDLQTAGGKRIPRKSSTTTAAERRRRSPERSHTQVAPRGPSPGGSKLPGRERMAATDSKPTPPKAIGEPRAAASSVAVDTHRVQSGDTLSSLAQIYYGDAKHTRLLIEGNPNMGDPNRLKVGALIKIPPLPADAEVRSAPKPVIRTASATENDAKPKVYTVKPGDTFYGVARDVLGDASRWKELLALNRELVQGDPTRLQIGQVIVLPES